MGTTEPVGGLLFGDGSAKEENHQGFFRTPSKKDDNSLDFRSAFLKPEEGLGDTEPTFLTPFSRTPPSKRLAFRVLRETIVKGRKFLELQTWNPHAPAKRVCPTI